MCLVQGQSCVSLNLPAIYAMFLSVTVDTSYPSCLQLLPSSRFPADVGGTAEINPFTSEAIQISTLTSLFKYFFMFYYERQMSFSYFEFKIRLIRPRLSFQKPPKIHVFERTTYWFSVRSHNHYIKEPTVSGRHRKAFSNLQSCLTLVEFT